MSMESTNLQIDIVVVDSVSLLQSVIDAAATGLQTNTNFPSLFIDIEGTNLGRRHGSISIISLYIFPRKTVYLIDIHKLGKEAFCTVNAEGKSLKYVLESPDILKVFFDARNDSSALFALYGVSIDGVRDVQLMELGTRTGSKEFLAGLDKCVNRDIALPEAEKQAWELVKGKTRRLFNPALGGRYEVFDERPMRQDIQRYCAGDVTGLPGLYRVYDAKLQRPGEEFWRVQVLDATKERVRSSKIAGFDETSKSKARGPWDRESIEEARDRWNDDIMDNAMNGEDDEFDWNDDIMDNAMNGEDDESDWYDDGPTSCRDIINDCDYDLYYSD